jgi:hypothetical protein
VAAAAAGRGRTAPRKAAPARAVWPALGSKPIRVLLDSSDIWSV